MDWKKILSLGLTIIFIFSALTLTVPSQIVKALPSRTATSSPANYPYSNWLSVWQSPNLTEPNSIAEPFWNDFPGANVTTPGMTADYWGTKWFFIYTPYLMRPAGWCSYWSYSWAQINDTNLFPADCKLTIQVSNATIAA